METMNTTTGYTVTAWLANDNTSWAYTVARAGRTLDTRGGYAERSHALAAGNRWLEHFVAVTLPEIKAFLAREAA